VQAWGPSLTLHYHKKKKKKKKRRGRVWFPNPFLNQKDYSFQSVSSITNLLSPGWSWGLRVKNLVKRVNSLKHIKGQRYHCCSPLLQLASALSLWGLLTNIMSPLTPRMGLTLSLSAQHPVLTPKGDDPHHMVSWLPVYFYLLFYYSMDKDHRVSTLFLSIFPSAWITMNSQQMFSEWVREYVNERWRRLFHLMGSGGKKDRSLLPPEGSN
jgi:hypothetical protein